MPIYEYGCQDCKHSEEIFFNKPIVEVENPKSCPKCGSENYERLLSSFGFDVPGGKMYLGKRDWKKNLSANEQSNVLLGGREPY
jgi:putative FmdB family regulatory protein